MVSPKSEQYRRRLDASHFYKHTKAFFKENTWWSKYLGIFLVLILITYCKLSSSFDLIKKLAHVAHI